MGLRVWSVVVIFGKKIKKVIRLCTVLKKKNLTGSFEDKAIFHEIAEIDR